MAVAELVVYRLAVPQLLPPDGSAPPAWLAALGYLGLFSFYFALALAALIVARRLVSFAKGDHDLWRPLGPLMVLLGAGLLTYATKSTLGTPSESDTFYLELCFSAMLALLILAQLQRGGDAAVKVGLVLVALPLLVRFYRDVSLNWIVGPEALWDGSADAIDAYAQWSMVLAALVSPYCFAPRPFSWAASKLAPLVAGTFTALLAAMVLRRHYELGYLMAKRGFGVELAVSGDTSQMALYLIALGSVAWVLTACAMSPAPARRQVGVGFALIVVSGFAFAWPLQYLVGLVGFFILANAARKVRDQERSAREFERTRFRAPPIADDVWQAYITELVAELKRRGYEAQTLSVADREPAFDDGELPRATARGRGGGRGSERSAPPWDRQIVMLGEPTGSSRTHVLVHGAALVPIRLQVDRRAGSIRTVEVRCGHHAVASGPPSLTVESRSDGLLASGRHPPPPPVGVRPKKLGDTAFDRRFAVRDRADLAADLFGDEGLRARLTAMVDGWLALWPDRALVYALAPGQGAPLDTPIPITQLAFGGGRAVPVDRLVTLLELLADLSERALATPARDQDAS